jgi:hypothetical protein
MPRDRGDNPMPDRLWELVKCCFRRDAVERPTAAVIAEILSGMKVIADQLSETQIIANMLSEMDLDLDPQFVQSGLI